MRFAVYTDYVYRRERGVMFAERAFALFLSGVGAHLDGLIVVGRLDPQPGRARYPLPPEVRFVELPFYGRISAVRESGAAMLRSLRRFSKVLDDVDGVWLLGPHPLAIVFAAQARARGKRVVLGVREDTIHNIRHRHPDRRSAQLAMGVLDLTFRLLARAHPVVVVGAPVARRYGRARRLLEMNVSLVSDRDIAPPELAELRSYDGELVVLSVGRLEPEKNPLLLADVLVHLLAGDPRWRLLVYGEGSMEAAVRTRLQELGVADRAELRGYVPIDEGLLDVYRSGHAFLHVSLTEGVPQVLFEAFASRLPMVTTAVGGVPETVGNAALSVPPSDAAAAAAALRRIASEPELRARLTEAGAQRVAPLTFELETRRVARFLTHPEARRPARAGSAGRSGSQALTLSRLELDRCDWETMDRLPDRVLFQSREWLEFLARTQGADPVVAELRRGGDLVGYFTGAIVRRYGVRILGSPFPGWTTPWMGFNLTEEVSRREATVALLAFARRTLRCVHLELKDRRLGLEEVAGLGLEHTRTVSFEIDLARSEDELFAGMSSACRRAIRKAAKSGTTVEEVEGPEFADEYYAQLIDVFAKQSLRPTYDVERVRELITCVHPTGRLLLLRAVGPDGQRIATGIFPAMNGTAYFWGGASWRRHQILRPNEAIFWYAMRYWRDRGMTVLDMGGGGDYKRRYGPEEVSIPFFRAASVPGLLRARDLAERLARRR
jgi:glycosyltransferase involved in cell wall biosynthesis